MPNHVRNILTFDCDENKLKEILERIQDDEVGIGSIDFNKIISIPKSLNMTCGSIKKDTISLYLTSINPDISYFGTDKLSSELFSNVRSKMETVQKYNKYNIRMTENQIKNSVNSVIQWPEYKNKSFDEVQASLVNMGKQYVDNGLNYGATTWYDWCIREWETKWSAFDYDEYVGGNSIAFSTAWSAPTPVIKRISELYQDILINHQWADEDLGFNVGEVEYFGNKQIRINIPFGGSKEAYEMAADIQDYSLAERGYRLSDDGSTYEYDEEYEIKMRGM